MQNRMIVDMDPGAASSAADLVGEAGALQVLAFDTDEDEAAAVADLIQGWLDDGIPPSEITVLVRQQPHLVAAVLGDELTSRGIAYRNEQESQDLTAEPAAALVFNYLRVVADERRPDAYAELMRIATRGSDTEAEGQILDSRLRKLLAEARSTARSAGFARADFNVWKPLVQDFLQFVSRPVLNALSLSYPQGTRLDDVLKQALEAFKRELAVDGDPVATLNRLSEEDAVRLLTIHKCKGLEFEKVVVLGVETDLFWGKDAAAVKSEFFVAVSRAKDDLILTHASYRAKPDGANPYWREQRTPHHELLSYATEVD